MNVFDRKDNTKKTAYIITSYIEGEEILSRIPEGRYIICADKGWKYAEKYNFKPDMIIGDFDSSEKPDFESTVILPAEKDITDSEAALDYAVSKGFQRIVIIGGLGGRLDHTMGNISLLAKYCDTPGVEVFIKDYQNLAFMKSAGTFRIANDEEYKYIGLISYGGNINSLTLKGFKYEIENRTLTDDTTLGVSNELVSDYGEITVKAGRLLIVMTRDK